MAEIEFKRRGTPVWAVLLVIVLIATIAYGVFGRGRSAATPASAPALAADSSAATAPATVATPVAPAMASTPALAKWADTAKMPTTQSGAAQHVASGLRVLAAAIKEQIPMAGGQQIMLGALADTLLMPDIEVAKQTDLAQAAFFAAAYAMRDRKSGSDVVNAATAVQLKKPLAQQKHAVDHYFQVAAKALADTTHAAQVPATAAPAKR